MPSHFDGMSSREMNGVPHLHEAVALRLWPNRGRTAVVAADQAEYVRSVFARCPSWRWRKRRKLAGAVEHAERVERMCAVSARSNQRALARLTEGETT